MRAVRIKCVINSLWHLWVSESVVNDKMKIITTIPFLFAALFISHIAYGSATISTICSHCEEFCQILAKQRVTE